MDNHPSYKIIKETSVGEIVEKKSRFIATVIPIQTEEEAISHIETLKKKYWDARHNCYGYVLGEKSELLRFSDDGEPQGTAGKPILEVIKGAELTNVLVVVTRYFGGTLLGTGGLIRAYTLATQEGITHNCIVTKKYGVSFRVGTDYNGIGKILYLVRNHGIEPGEAVYGEAVEITLTVPATDYEVLVKEITEATAGKAQITELETGYYEF